MPYLGKQPANVPVTADDIPDNSITSAKILDGVITIADIANDAVTEDKLANSINTAIAANTAKTGITSGQASAITANTAKTGITSGQATAITAALPKAGGAMTGAITSNNTISDVSGNVRSGRKNLLINGGFDVWQRGTSATKSGDGYGGYLSADRWATYYSGNTISRQTGTFNGSTKYVARVAGSAGSTNYIYQKIESASSFVSGKTVTQSYWARANVAVTLYSEYRFYNSGGEVNNVQTTLPTVALTTSWQKITDTRVLTDSSTDLTRDLFVLFKADCNNSGDYIEIADVQVELGSVATDFEHRSYGEELALCHKYYQTYGSIYFMATVGRYADSSGLWCGTWSFPNGAMRAEPTVTYHDQASTPEAGKMTMYAADSSATTTHSINFRPFGTRGKTESHIDFNTYNETHGLTSYGDVGIARVSDFTLEAEL